MVSMSEILKRLPKKIGEVDYDDVLKSLSELPKAVLDHSLENLHAAKYEESERYLAVYEGLYKVANLLDVGHLVNGELKENYLSQKKALEELIKCDDFYNNSEKVRAHDDSEE